MLNKTKHEAILNRILLDIYTDKQLTSWLGFKGGTACYFMYNLPRFSTDLDFNLLSPKNAIDAMKAIQDILVRYGTIKDSWKKYHTLYFLLSYSQEDYNVKVEISTHTFAADTYEIQSYYGLPVQLLRKDSMVAHKLVAITDRRQLVNRDLFDAWFFLKNNWPINPAIILERTGKTKAAYFSDLVSFLEKLKTKNPKLLAGLGEVLDAKQKVFVKEKLLDELLFLIQSDKS